MARKKNTNVNQMEQVHGQVKEFEPTTLNQVWGDDGLWKYKTMDKDVYLRSLHEMNSAELRGHAIKIGLVPVADRERLVKRLMVEFSKHVASYQRPVANNQVQPKNPPKEIVKFLAEAK